MKAIHPLSPLVNRKAKRLYLHEVEKIANKIDDIQVKFEYAIFEAPKFISYQQIYDVFLAEWMELVEKIVKVYRLKHCFIDLHYFERKYKSVI